MRNKYLLILLVLQDPLCSTPTDTSSTVAKISQEYLGQPYVWGGNTPQTGMDCSGYTKYVFKKVGISIPRTALTQSKVGKIVDRKNLKKGDLLFFLTDKKRGIPVTHVGIYLDNGKFIHAASKKKGIIISSLNGKYGKLFIKAKRVIDEYEQKVFKKNIDNNSNQDTEPNDEIFLAFSSILDEEVSMSKINIQTTSFSNFKKL